jgi:hypothetical protein
MAKSNHKAQGAADELESDMSDETVVRPKQGAQTKKVSAKSQLGPKIERRTEAVQTVWSDLWKLLVSTTMKQIGIENHPDENPQSFIDVEHCHFFRTVDSDGKKFDRCTPIANHFHLVKTEINADDPKGPPVIVEVSPPMRMAKTKKLGKFVMAPVPLNDFDFHTHDVAYVKSEEVKTRAPNVEAAKVMALEAQKGAPVAGVGSRDA